MKEVDITIITNCEVPDAVYAAIATMTYDAIIVYDGGKYEVKENK